MFLVDYESSDFISMSDVQFAVAIALDSINETVAAEKVLYLFQYSSTTNSLSEGLALEKELTESGDDIVQGFINALFTDNLFQNRLNNYYNGDNHVNLDTFLKYATRDMVYNATMHIISSTKSERFIVLYMRTSMWVKVFSKRAVGYNSNTSKEVIDDLGEAFLQFISDYSANGAYQTSTRNPNAFLWNAYISYFKNKETYNGIINNKSVMSSVTKNEDKRTIAEMYNDSSDIRELEAPADTINFRQLARKIYEASYSLFCHGSNDGGIPYYDIFSWYKRRLAESQRKTYNASFTALQRIYDVTYLKDTTEYSQEIKNKYEARLKICDDYAAVFRKGVALEDVYNVYKHIASNQYFYAKGKTKDGIAFLDYSGVSTKKGNNAEKFQKQYEGFIALRELLEFLESPKNDTGVSVFDFPVDIFRNPKLLNRFHNIYDYVELHKDVIELLHNIECNSARNEAISVDGLWHNDAIYQKMLDLTSEQSNLKLLLGKASNRELSEVFKLRSRTKDEIFTEEVTDPLDNFIELCNKDAANLYDEQYMSAYKDKMRSAPVAIISLIKVALRAYKVFSNKEASVIWKKNAALAVIAMLDNTLEIAGNPIEVDQIAVIGDKSIRQLLIECGIKEGVQPVKIGASVTNLDVISTIEQIFTFSVQLLMSEFASSVDLILVFNVARIINGFAAKMMQCKDAIVKEIRDANEKMGGNRFLCYAKMVHNFPILNIKYPIKDIVTIRDFAYKGIIVDKDKIFDSANTRNIIAAKQKDNATLLLVINDYFSYYAPLCSIFNSFRSVAKTELHTVSNVVGISVNKYEELTKLSVRITLYYQKNGYAYRLERFCAEYGCDFDPSDYLKKNGEFVTLNGGNYYVHKYGYKVSPSIRNNVLKNNANAILRLSADIQALTDRDIGDIDLIVRY